MEVPGKLDRTTPKTSDSGELFCSPCKIDNKLEKADGYCEVCKEYFCATCEGCHRKFRLTKAHHILKGSDIPYTSSLSSDTTCTEPCDKHPEEFIKYICHDHNVLACGACTTMDHRTCKIGYIPDIAKTFKSTEWYKLLVSNLAETGLKLANIQLMAQNGRSNSDSLRNAIKNETQTLRSQMNTVLDKQEQELLEKASQFSKHNKTIYDEMLKREAITRQHWQSLYCELEQQGESLSKQFITAKRIEPDVTRIQTAVDDIFKHSHVQKYKFRPSKVLESLMALEDVIGKILPVTLCPATANISFDRKINIKHIRDEFPPCITGMDVISSDRVLLADWENNTLKLVDTTNQTVLSYLELSDKPLDVTCISSNQSAVTIPNKQQIAIISTKDPLSETRTINMNIKCHGVFFGDGKLIASGEDTNKTKLVQVLGLDGTIYKTVSVGSKNEWFINEFFVTQVLNWPETYIFTRDDKRNFVMISSDGEVVSRLQDSRLTYPTGLVALGDNSVAVCSNDGKHIYIITEENGEVTIVNQWDSVKCPAAIAFSENNNTIFMSSTHDRDRQCVYLYKLTQ